MLLRKNSFSCSTVIHCPKIFLPILTSSRAQSTLLVSAYSWKSLYIWRAVRFRFRRAGFITPIVKAQHFFHFPWLWRSSYIFYWDTFSWNHWYVVSVWLSWFQNCSMHFFQIFKNRIRYILLVFCCGIDIPRQLWIQCIWVEWINLTAPEATFQVIRIQHIYKLLQQSRKNVFWQSCLSVILKLPPLQDLCPFFLQWSIKHYIQRLWYVHAVWYMTNKWSVMVLTVSKYLCQSELTIFCPSFLNAHGIITVLNQSLKQ